MKIDATIIKKAFAFRKIEFWVITTMLVFAIFFHVQDFFNWDDHAFAEAGYRRSFLEAKMPFHIYRNYFYPQFIKLFIIYFFVLYLNFFGIPKLMQRRHLLRNLLWLAAVVAVTTLVFGTLDTYLKAYLYAGGGGRDFINQQIFLGGFEMAFTITSIVAFYIAIKLAAAYLLSFSKSVEAKYNYIRREAFVAMVLWVIGILVLRFGRADEEILVGWTIIVPSAIALYLYSLYRLIPRALSRKKFAFTSYFFTCAIILIFAFVGFYLLSMLITQDDDAGAGYSAFNSFFQLFVTVPVTWMLYKKQLKTDEAMYSLQKELSQSSANYDFLRSQINPHFLFNALNTIYGTALQEKAERTSEGIEKLGDMMRFMLQENMQDKIPLAREVDYLENYISLQKLRTDPDPRIKIEVHIAAQAASVKIAPMLLIPFVENAFKHGLSFREDAYIKIALELKDDTLYFDVANSKHQKKGNDPEREKSGIGLTNVRQRLQLLYKGKHELLIRETPKDFFVHLTLQFN